MFVPNDKTAYDYLLENAALYPDELFVETETSSYSWAVTKGIVDGLISQMKEKGVSSRSTVAFHSFKQEKSIFLLIALLSMGSTILLADPYKDMSSFLSGIDCSVDFVLDCDGEWALNGEAISFEKGVCTPDQVDTKKAKVVIFTSGSSGKTKGVVLSQYALLNNSRHQGLLGGVERGEKLLLLVQLHHAFGLAAVLARLTLASALFLPKSDKPPYVAECIETYRCTILDGVPTLYYAIIASLRKEKRDLSSLKRGIIAGGTYLKEQFLTIERELSITLCPSYGMSETATLIAGASITDSDTFRAEGCGKFASGVDGVIKTKGGVVKDCYMEGEICVKGYNLMEGYLGGSDFLDEEGYFHTGDLGYLDQNGSVHISGRIKDIIIRGGENLSPRRIENEVMKCDGVEGCIVVGVYDDYYGEAVGIMVVSEKTEEELRAFLKTVLSPIEQPKVLRVVSKIPTLSSGKTDVQLVKKILNEYLPFGLKKG